MKLPIGKKHRGPVHWSALRRCNTFPWRSSRVCGSIPQTASASVAAVASASSSAKRAINEPSAGRWEPWPLQAPCGREGPARGWRVGGIERTWPPVDTRAGPSEAPHPTPARRPTLPVAAAVSEQAAVRAESCVWTQARCLCKLLGFWQGSGCGDLSQRLRPSLASKFPWLY